LSRERRLSTRGRKIALELLLIIVLASSFSSEILLANGTSSIFDDTFGGSKQDVARSVQQTSDGGYIVAGWTMSFGVGLSDFWLIKIDSNGVMQWNRTYGGTGNDEAYSVEQTTDGGYITAGSTASYGAGMCDFWLVKTDANGIMQWSKSYGGAENETAFYVRQTFDGGYIVAGYTDSFGAGGSDGWLVKTDTNGQMQWNKTYGGAGTDQAYSVVQTRDGGYIIAGETNSSGAGDFNYWLVRTDSAGTQLWSKTYGGATTDVATSVQQTNDSGYIVAGYTDSFGAGGSDGWLVKTDTNGQMQWNKTYGDINDEVAYSIQLASGGEYLVAGGTTSNTTGGWDFWIIRTDALGNMKGEQTNGGTADDIAYSAQQTSDGGYIAVGFTNSYGAGSSDFWVVKSASPPPRPPPPPPPPPEILPPDVAVIGVSTSKSVVGQGFRVTITAIVENKGDYNVTFKVSTYGNTTLIQVLTVRNLASEENATIIFTWNTASYAKGTYTIKAMAEQLPKEANTTDNTLTNGTVTISIPGDVNGDGTVNFLDLRVIEKEYGRSSGSHDWIPEADVNGDNIEDILDLWLTGKNYGQTKP
jgi:hypothetical protein